MQEKERGFYNIKLIFQYPNLLYRFIRRRGGICTGIEFGIIEHITAGHLLSPNDIS
jgi:hypothetical protein